jgi:hypothetical protein
MREQDWGLNEGYMGITDEWPPVCSTGYGEGVLYIGGGTKSNGFTGG